jgi:ribosomal protein L29
VKLERTIDRHGLPGELVAAVRALPDDELLGMIRELKRRNPELRGPFDPAVAAMTDEELLAELATLRWQLGDTAPAGYQTSQED